MKQRIVEIWSRLEGREFLARLRPRENNMHWLWVLLGVAIVGLVGTVGFIWFEIWRLSKL